MDDAYLVAAARYIELNPVRAGLVATAEQYPWSSAAAHLNRREDALVRREPLLALVPDWADYLREPWPTEQWEAFRRHERTGRPLGSAPFVADLETQLGRPLRPQKAGQKPRAEGLGE